MKKTVLILAALVMSFGAFAQILLEPSDEVEGVYVYDENYLPGWFGANIMLGADFSVWPFSQNDDDVTAFTPVKDGEYTLRFTFLATGAGNQMRVRWISSNGYGSNWGEPFVAGMFGEGVNGAGTPGDPTDGTGGNGHGRFSIDVSEAGNIPAAGVSANFFNTGYKLDGVYTHVVNFKMEDNAPGDNIGSLGIRGGGGWNAFYMLQIIVEDSEGNQLVNWKAPDDLWPPSSDKAIKVGDATPTGVYFDILGRKLSAAPEKGAYIMMMSDGKAVKAMK
ncbi:MAG: hypothetical protein LBI82_08160 [Dysgonamonadaceae bacterium]|jgi:hypothetical protein|nr:hypothetical protein [Dysgonamonadaceae bacterium]